MGNTSKRTQCNYEMAITCSSNKKTFGSPSLVRREGRWQGLNITQKKADACHPTRLFPFPYLNIPTLGRFTYEFERLKLRSRDEGEEERGELIFCESEVGKKCMYSHPWMLQHCLLLSEPLSNLIPLQLQDVPVSSLVLVVWVVVEWLEVDYSAKDLLPWLAQTLALSV